MLARSSVLRHPSDVALRTPLLVPSFSSRGCRFDRKGRSEIRDIFTNTAEILTESMLVSAYDITYKHLPKPNRFPCTPVLTFVDSGGYETGADHDFSVVYKYAQEVKPWDLPKLQHVFDSWPERIPAVFVSFDKESAGKGVRRQIEAARRLFDRYPEHLHSFLLKPTWRCQGLLGNTLQEVRPLVTGMNTFDIIGVTEAELGRTVLDRMATVATLRRYLDDAGIAAPIQVFGALDPVSSCLYLLAGGEIFDGLTWLRFSYKDGQCFYQQNYGARDIGIDQDEDFVKSKIFSDNYAYLRNLQLRMRDFVTTKKYSTLEHNVDFLQRAADSLKGRLQGGV